MFDLREPAAPLLDTTHESAAMRRSECLRDTAETHKPGMTPALHSMGTSVPYGNSAHLPSQRMRRRELTSTGEQGLSRAPLQLVGSFSCCPSTLTSELRAVPFKIRKSDRSIESEPRHGQPESHAEPEAETNETVKRHAHHMGREVRCPCLRCAAAAGMRGAINSTLYVVVFARAQN